MSLECRNPLPPAMDQSETTEQSPELLGFSGVLRDHLVAGVLALDAEGTICGLDSGAELLTGVNARTAIGQSARTVPPPLGPFLAEALAAKESAIDRHLVFEQGESPRRVEASTTRCWGPSGERAGIVVMLRDLTAADKIGWNIQRLDRLASLGTLSAGLAHEIKNALVTVSTFVQQLIQRNKDNELAALVRRELQRIDTIVGQMLKSSGPAKPNFSRVSVHRILDQSLRLIQPQLASKQISLRRSFAARHDRVQGDDYQLEQAFINLLLNSITAMNRRGELGVRTEIGSQGEGDSPTLEIVISDTGVGIPPENLSRLFEPFFTTRSNGTGLGLAITRRIVMEHRGRITVQSEVNKGTSFRVLLPLSSPAGM